MGMSASQARLLFLTAQLNNLSLKGQNVSDAKARLALDTQAIQDKYIRALNSSRLYMNSNIFSVDGSVNTTEYITLANLAENGLKVSDGSNVLGYKRKRVPTGETEFIKMGYEEKYANANSKVIREFAVATEDSPARGNASEMQEIVDRLGLSSDDLSVLSYRDTINGEELNVNSIVIKSQAGFESVIKMLEEASDDGEIGGALSQNYSFDIDEVNMSNISCSGISGFSGIFDGNGVKISGLTEDSALFKDVSGIIKNVNIDGEVVTEVGSSLGSLVESLTGDGVIENCNNVSVNTTGPQADSTQASAIKYKYVEVALYEDVLVEDPDFKISSLALEQGLRSGAYTLIKESAQETVKTVTINGVFYNTIDLSSCSVITDEVDDDVVKKAEAEYNRDMTEIQTKDKRYEMDQKKIDTQYNAYMTEEESIKNVLSKNVERSYNTFKA